jgi:RNA polymerase sigma-70 factor (ECF subfamily)
MLAMTPSVLERLPEESEILPVLPHGQTTRYLDGAERVCEVGLVSLTLLRIRGTDVESATSNMDYATISPEELVRVCAYGGSAAAWEEFIRRFNPLIAGVVIRSARRWGTFQYSLVDDLVQDIYLKLCADQCRLLRDFESREPNAVFGYLKVVTANVVHDYFKATYAAKRGAGEAPEDIDILNSYTVPSTQDRLGNQASLERNILMREIDTYLHKSVAEGDLRRCRLIFWLYYRSGLSASAIAAIPSIGLSTKGVESMLLRLTRSVRTAVASETPRERDRKKEGSSADPTGITQVEPS